MPVSNKRRTISSQYKYAPLTPVYSLFFTKQRKKWLSCKTNKPNERHL